MDCITESADRGSVFVQMEVEPDVETELLVAAVIRKSFAIVINLNVKVPL